MEMERKVMREGQGPEMGTVREAFTRLRDDVKDIGNRLVNVSRDKAKASATNVNRFAHEKPYIATVIGLGVGTILGGLLVWLLRRGKKAE